MKRTITSLLFSFLFRAAVAQSEFIINDFSPAYYAKVVYDKDGTGIVSIIRKNDNVVLMKAAASQLDMDETNGKKTVPYKDQSVLVYDDFNFDGQMDVAVPEFYSAKGPALAVYLFNNDTFLNNEAFSNVIGESQGNYKLNAATRTINTYISGGCCLHTSSSYVVVDGKPVPLTEESEEIAQAYTTVTKIVWKDGKKTTTVDKTLTFDDEPIMSFKLAGKNKTLMLFTVNDRSLNYVLVKEKDKVEFNFPPDDSSDQKDFTLNGQRDELVFSNASAKYKIYQRSGGGKIQAVGILVTTGGKEFDLQGDIATLKGSLSGILNMENVGKE